MTDARILAVTSELPWPLTSGGHLRSFYLVRALARAFSHVALVAPTSDANPAGLQALADAGIEVHPVTVGARRTPGETGRVLRAVLTGEPYAFYHRHNWRGVRRQVRDLLQDWRPDALYLDHLDSFVYADLAPDVPRVLDMHNVYSTIVSRMAEGRGGLRARMLAIEAARVATVERRAVRAVDLTLSVSEDDGRVFRDWSARQLAVVPNGVDCGMYAALPIGRPATAAPKLAYVGALSWAPNVAAARRLATDILDVVRRRHPEAEVRIIGRDPGPDVTALGAIPGVRVCANVPDVRPYLEEASALVVPLDVGGGTRLKILEAFAAGLPVVSTPVGCEGLGVIDGTHLLVADADRVGDAVVRLLDEPGLGVRLAAHARQLAADTYDWDAVGRAAARAIAGIIRNQGYRTAAAE